MKFSFIVMKKKVESLSISRECREEVSQELFHLGDGNSFHQH